MNKKGAVITYITMAGFFLALTIFYFYKIEKIETTDIGEIQMATLKTMQEAEKDLLYIDNAAKLSVQQAIYELADKGGFKDKSNCGEYGYQLWNNNERECFPDYENNFTSLFNDKLNKFLAKFNLIDNYNFILKDKLQIIGKAVNNLTLDIRIIAEKIRAVIEYIIPEKAEEIIKKIKELYRDKILREIAGKYPKPEESLVGAVIAQESKGDPNAISPTGCSGVLQFCYCTAWSYSSLDTTGCVGYKKTGIEIFNYLKSDQKKGTQILPDDRFDPDKSIEAGVIYLSNLLNQFEKYDDNEEFAVASYNAGLGVILNAIKKTGKNNPSWQDVAQQITPDLITYFGTLKERSGKVQEVIKYVSLVMGYKKTYEELDQTSVTDITGAVIKSISGKSLGKYSINPSFKVNLDYDLDEYELVKEQAKQLIDECKNKDNIKLCINNQIKNFENKDKYSIDAYETEEEEIINEFIELYESCYESKGTCYCEIDFDKEYVIDYENNMFKINNFEKEYEMILFPLSLKKIEIKEDEIKAELTYTETKRETGEGEVEKEWNPKGDLVFYKEEIEGPMGKIKIKTIQIAKINKDKDEIEFYNGNKVKNIKECKLKSQRKFKFSYKTGKQILTEQGLKEPIIKFALMFPDITPPEALDVNVLNYPNDKYKIILTWNKAEDGIMYKIYYSDEDFKDEKISDLKEEEITKIELDIEKAEEIEEIELNNCNFDPVGQPCKFGKYNNKLDSDKLYYVKKDDEYVYVLDLEGNYNFLVTAVDDSDNEINDIEDKSYKTIKSKNKLPFKAIRNLKVVQEDNNVKLTWEKPDKYKDGTSFEDEELKGYHILITRKATQEVEWEIDIDKIEIHTFIGLDKDDFNFAVAAVNNDDIIGDYLQYP